MACDYPAIVKGRSSLGKKFEENARVVNLSATGIYVIVNCAVQDGSELAVKIDLPNGHLDLGTSKLATTGVVVRREPLSVGVYGVAVQIQRYRFL